MLKGKMVTGLAIITISVMMAMLAGCNSTTYPQSPWTYTTPAQDVINDFACCRDGSVILATYSELQLIGPDGKLMWQSPSFSSLSTGQPGHVYADPHQNRFLYVSLNGDVLAFDLTGKHLFSVSAPEFLPSGKIIRFNLDGTIYAAFGKIGIKVIDSSGQVTSTIPLEGYHGYKPASIGPTGNIYYVYGEGLVFNGQTPVYPGSSKTYRRALDSSGKELWKHQDDYLGAYDRFHPVNAKTVVIGHRTQGLVAYDANGNQLWQASCPTDCGDNIAIDSRRIYVSGHQGLRAYSHGGKKLWDLPVDFWTRRPVAGGSNIVYCLEEYVPPEIAAKGDSATMSEWEAYTSYYLLAVDAASGAVLMKEPWQLVDSTDGTPRPRPDGSVVIHEGNTLRCLYP